MLINSFLFLSLLSFGQLHIGFKEASNISLDFFQSTRYQVISSTYSPGLIFKYTQTPKWGLIQMDVNLVQKKFDLHKSSTDFDQINTQIVHFNFLSHFQFGKSKFKYGFNAGTYLSYLLSAQRNFSDADTSFSQQVLRSEKYSPRLDYGITGGLSFCYQFLYGDIQLDANFSLSYSSLTASLDQQAFDFRNNQLVQIGVAYLFCPARLKNRKKSQPKEQKIVH